MLEIQPESCARVAVTHAISLRRHIYDCSAHTVHLERNAVAIYYQATVSAVSGKKTYTYEYIFVTNQQNSHFRQLYALGGKKYSFNTVFNTVSKIVSIFLCHYCLLNSLNCTLLAYIHCSRLLLVFSLLPEVNFYHVRL